MDATHTLQQFWEDALSVCGIQSEHLHLFSYQTHFISPCGKRGKYSLLQIIESAKFDVPENMFPRSFVDFLPARCL